MKKIAVILSACALMACNQEQNKTVRISGKINNPLSETASILSSDRSNLYTDTLDENNNFNIEFEVEEPAYMSFKHGRETTAMYVKPGDQIQLSIDPNEFDETINYTGSNQSNFLAKKYLVEEQIDRRALYSLTEEEFLQNCNKHEAEIQELLKLVVDETFKTEQKKALWLEWVNTKMMYPNYYQYLTGNKLELSEAYYDYLNDLDLNDVFLFENEEGYNFLQNYIAFKTENEENGHMLAQLNFIAENIGNQEHKDQISYDILKSYIKNETFTNIAPIIDQFKAVHSDTIIHNELHELAVEMSLLSPGKPALDFTYPDVNGKEISLSDFEGSYVYVDVWATWCGPCKREIPHLVELEKDYHDKNIVFLSVSVDEEKDRETWLNMLEEKEMGGVQLFASGWSKITKDYRINGIPRFMLFDPNGNIVDTRASRPSEPRTRELFDQIL